MEWKYLLNQLETETEKNHRKGLVLSNYHHAALKAKELEDPTDPDWAFMLNRYNNPHIAFSDAYTNRIAAGFRLKGSTETLDDLLDNITVQLDDWDTLITPIYGKKSVTYKTLFAQGRKPFQQGPKEDRIKAVDTLAKLLDDYPLLATTKAAVIAFYNQLDGARDTQAGKKGSVTSNIGIIKTTCEDAMWVQYQNLGFLMSKYGRNTQLIKPYFDLITLLERTQTKFTGTLNPTENKNIATHTFLAGERIRLKVTEAGDVKFYLGSAPGYTDSTPILVTGNHQMEADVADFAVANYHVNRYLVAVSQSATTVVKFEVKFL